MGHKNRDKSLPLKANCDCAEPPHFTILWSGGFQAQQEAEDFCIFPFFYINDASSAAQYDQKLITHVFSPQNSTCFSVYQGILFYFR